MRVAKVNGTWDNTDKRSHCAEAWFDMVQWLTDLGQRCGNITVNETPAWNTIVHDYLPI